MNQQQPDSAPITVACHVRAPLLFDPIDSKIETLRSCEAEGIIDSLVLRSWPDEVALDDDAPEHEVVDRFERFEEWATTYDVSIRPPFTIRETTSMVSDTAKRRLVTPVLCLALYHENALVGVYPHTDGGTTHSVVDAIGDLRTGTLPPLPETAGEIAVANSNEPSGDRTGFARSSEPSGQASVSPTTCPDCAGPLGNVQGIVTCTTCAWNDTHLDQIESPQAKLVYLSLLDEPVSVPVLKSTLGLGKLTLYGILQSLSERGLVVETERGTYRACRLESQPAERTAPKLRPK